MVTNFVKLEKELDNIALLKKNAYKNKTNKKEINIIDKIQAEDIQDEYGIPQRFIIKEIKLRRKNFNKKNPEIKKYYDLPGWQDKTRCPLCNSKLVVKWEGLVCQNNCPLSFKINKGWVYLQRDSGWSKARNIINGCFGENRRNYLQREFSKLRKDIIIRDDYKCRMCEYSLSDDFHFKVGLEVHHIVPASEEMAMYLDKNNLITLCKNCHKKIHSEDKYNFGDKNE